MGELPQKRRKIEPLDGVGGGTGLFEVWFAREGPSVRLPVVDELVEQGPGAGQERGGRVGACGGRNRNATFGSGMVRIF